MKNLYVFLLALVWLSVGSIRANPTTDDKVTDPTGLAAAPTFTFAKTDVLLCNGQATGSISITASGGTGSYQYSKDNGANFTDTPQFTNLTAGTYQVVVKDGSNVMSAAQTVTINQPAALTATVTSVTSTCPGLSTGAISISAGGGVGTYQYSLNDGSSYQASSLFTALPAGFYPLSVKDANGCVFGNTTYEVTAPTAPTVTPAVTNISCNGLQNGSIQVTLSGGVNIGQAYISIDNGANYTTNTQFNLLGVGTYPVLVKYANNCLTSVQSVSVTQPAAVSFSTSITNTINCYGATTGSIAVTATGGSGSYVYSKDNGNTYQDGSQFGELSAGSYQIAVQDVNGCTAPVQTVVLSQPTAVTYTITQTDVSCFGGTDGSISIEASGGTGPYEYNFSAYGPALIRNPTVPRTNSRLTDGRGARLAAGAQYDNLAAQAYYITIHDANGCYNSTTVTINQPSAVVVETSVNSVQCNGGSSGSITVIPSGGTAPYKYSRDNGATFQDNAQFTGLPAGAYSVVAKDAHSCLSAAQSVTVTEPSVVTFTVDKTDATCAGGSTGSIVVNASGGIDSYQYSRNNGATYQSSNTFMDLAAGTYLVIVKDANGCVSSAQSVTIGQPDLLTFSVTKTDVTDCFGNSSGSISVSASGGTAYYLYSINNGNSYTDDRFFANLEAGTYSVGVKDANGCVSAFQSVTLTQPTAISYTVAQTNVSCNGSATGSFTITASGGTPPYRLSLNGGEFDAMRSPSGLVAGDYTIAVGDANGCSTSQSVVTITQPDPLTFTRTVTNVSCNGGNTGQITLTASGGTGTYQYSKDNGTSYQASNQFTNLGAGTYVVVVKDANNCITAAQSVTVMQPAVLTASTSKTNVTTCFGGTNGSITVTASGGTSAYQYSKDNGANFQSDNQFTGLSAGTYQVVVKDANNCVTAAQSVTITQPTLLTFTTAKVDVTGCFGNSTGVISVTAAGGTGAYQYSKDNGANFQAGNQFANLPAGTYQIVVKDANSCVANAQSIALNQPAALSATTTVTNVSCFSGTNGAITVQVTGGTAPYRYSITDGSSYQTSNQFTGLSARTYPIIVRDANDCSLDAPSTQVTQPDPVTFNANQVDVTCFGGNSGSITVDASGGTGAYQYSKNNGVNFQASNQFDNLIAGIYPIVVKDANNCLSNVQSLTIDQPSSISLTAAKTNVTTCFGATNGTITLTATGGKNEFQYSIDNGQTYQGPTFEGLAAGTYTVVARDGYACPSPSQTVVIGQPTAVSFTTAKTDVTTCFSASVGSITVTASGGTAAYQYSKDNGSTFQTSNQFAGLPAGTYQVVVKDANGCTTSAQSIVINQPNAIEATVTSMTQTCPGLSVGVFSVSASGGTSPYQYSLNNGNTFQTSTLFTGLGVGAYQLTVKDANGCVVNFATYQMTSSVAPTVTPHVTNVSCNGGQNGSIDIDVTGGADLGQVYASINNGSTFTTNLIFNSLAANTYQVVVKYGNSCLTPVQSVTLTQPAVLAFSTTKVNVTGCFGNTTGSISISATGGTAPYQYSKDNGATFQEGNQFTNLSAGTYVVLVKDANGCQTSAQSVTLTQPSVISYTVAQTNVSCNGSATGSFTITASGGTPPYRLSLNGGEFDAMRSPSGLVAGDYTIAVGDANGCATSQSIVTITQPDPLTFTSAATDVSCNGGNTGQITLTASGGTGTYQYSKNNGSTYQAGNQFANLGAGTYSVIVKDANNCVTSAQSFTIAQPAVLSVVSSKTNVTTCFGGTNGSISLTATGGSGSYQYSRDNGANYQPNSTFTDLGAGTYQVVVKDGNNCTTTAQTITITQPAIVTLSLSKTNVTTCFGASTGSISLTASGGTGDYQYSKDNGANFQAGNLFADLPAGTYQVVVKDANGCASTTQSTTISQPTALSATTTATNVSCFSGTNGAIAVQVTGGTTPYRYSITDGSTYQTSNQFTGLSAGTYHFIVRDANDCPLDAPTTEVTQPDAITFSTSQTDVACFGGNSGSITVTASGGTGAYQYSKNSGANFQASNQFLNLAAGPYSIIVKDANGCLSSVSSVSLSQPQALVVTASKTDIINCSSANTGSISLSATGGAGGYQYSINNGESYQDSPQFTDLQAGVYAVIVKDANDCQAPTSLTVTPACCLTTTASPDVITNGQSATLTASGCSGTVNWVGGPTNSIYVVNPTITTSYTAICAISGGSTCRNEVTVTVIPLCAISVTANPATITNGQSSTLTASGCSGAISWVGTVQEGSAYVVNPTQTTTYTAICTLSASNTCSSQVTVTVNQPGCNLTTSASPLTITNGQSSTLTASGCSGTVNWVGGPTNSVYIVNPTQTTSYTAICSIATSGSPVTCSSVVTVTVNQPVCSITTSASPATIASGQSSTLTASECSGSVYWSGGGVDRGGNSIVVNPTQTTSYTASCVIPTSSDPVICASEVTVTIGQPVCSVTTSASPTTITNGQSSTLTASGCAGTVSWVGGPGSAVYVVNPTQTTTYTAVCSLSQSNTCTSSITVTVNQPVCTLTTSTSSSTITNGQSATLTASGCSGTVSWVDGPTNSVYIVNPTQTTSYTATCTITTSGSPVTCQSIVMVTVNQPPCNLVTSASPTTITIGQSSTLTASGCSGVVYWSGGGVDRGGSSIVVNPTQTTSYTASCVIPTSGDPVICASEVTVTVNQPVCSITTSASPTTITNGQSSTLTASGCSGTVSWIGGPTALIYVVNPTQTTSYTAICTLSESNTCTSSVTVTVNQPACNLTTSASSLTITNGQSTTLTASGCNGTVNWVGGPTNSVYIVNPTQTTSYTATCTITTSGSPVTCTSVVTVTVNQPPCNLITSSSPTTITNGQSATLTASGCSGTITWTNTEQTGSSIVVNPSVTTTYIATCTIPTSGSPVSCTSAVTVTVNPIPCTLTTSASPLTITNGQSSTLTASSCSGTVSWVGGPSNSVYVVNPTQTTTYTAICTLSASNTCSSIVTVTVNQPVCTLTTSASPTTITNGQSATLTASGCSGTVNWIGGPTALIYVVNPTQTTSYTAICSIATSGAPVTCSSVVTVTVNQPPCNLVTSASPTTITIGQSSTLTASGCSGTITWTNTEQTGSSIVVSPSATTTYIATCSIPTSGSPVSCTSAVTVTVNPLPCTLTTSASPLTITNGQSSTLTASSCSGMVSWVGGPSNSVYIVNPTQTTTYTAICTLSESNTCSSQVTVTVNQPPCTLTTSASPTTITNGQSTTLIASGCSGTVNWVGGPTALVYVVNPTQTTSYTAICTIATSGSPVTCQSIVTVTVNQPPCNLTTSASAATIINGQSTTLTASGCSGTVSWIGGPTNSVYVVNPAQTTSYTATCSIPTSGSPVTCTSVVTVTVNQPTCTLAAQANPTTIFNGQRATLTATGCANGTISWSNSQQIGSTLVVSPTVTTVYTASCTIPTSGSPVICTAPVTVTVIARPDCNLQVQTNTPTIFTGGTATLTATGCSGSVNWNNGQAGASITVSPTITTSYSATCTISTAAGSVTCLASATVTVIARPACNLSVQANPTAIFNGQSTTLTASGCTNGTIAWSTQQSGFSIVVSPTLTTAYAATCVISTEAGSVSCTAPVSVSVTQPILQIAGSSDILPLNAVTWIGTVTQNIGSFVWQYKTATGDWVNFPSTYNNSTSITVSATSFLGSAAPAYLNQAIQLRVLSPILISNVLTVTIRQTPPTISSLTTVKAVCSGSSTGSFSLILSRGVEAGESAFQARVYSLAGGVETLVSSYTFTGATFTSPSVFGKGSYRVRVQSIVGSQMSEESVQDFAIDENPPITLSATKTDVLCFGGANGTISLVATGGTGPYQFAINGGAFQNFQSGAQHQINNLASGTYSIQLRDGNACLSAQPISVTIGQPATVLTITNGVVKNPTGFQLTDGTITLTVTGGTPDYSFAWSVSNPATSTQPANPGVTHTISNLGGGTFTVVVTDKAGCTTQASYTLTQPTQIQAKFTIVKAISCAKSADGSVSVDASGGVPKLSGDPYLYSWKVKSSGSVIPQTTNRLTNVGSTTYVVTVTDANGVSRDFEVFLAEPLPLVATVASQTNVSCFGSATGAVSLAIQGGATPYVTRWNTQQTGLSLASMQAGKYLAVITDANACQAQVSVQIQQPLALTVALAAVNPSCYDNCDGRITATLAGGAAPYTVAWQNPVSQSLSLTGLCSGSYTVSVTDANGCAVTQTTSLTRPVQKQIVLRANTFICKGQVVDLDGTIADGATYVWTYPDGSTKTTAIVSVTAAGKYQVVATDKNGCVSTAQITLTSSDTPAPTLAFAVGSKVGIGEPLIAVNLTNPRPAQSSWTAPVGAQIVSSTEDQLVVTFNQLGTYPITLNGQQGQCEFKTTKTVTVVAEPQLTTSISTTPFIQELTILPNPSSGEFKVRITLSGVSDVKIKVKPLLSTGVDIYQQSATGQNVYELSVNIPNLQTGIYLLTLETAQAIQSTKLLIAR